MTSIEYDESYGKITIDGSSYNATDITYEAGTRDNKLCLQINTSNGAEYLIESQKKSFLGGYGDVGKQIKEFTELIEPFKKTRKIVEYRTSIINGNIPNIEAPDGILLKKDEFTVMTDTSVKYCQEKTKTTYYGGGGSVRIMKGVTIRGGKAIPVKEDYLATLDVGRLTLTNKRLIFSGNRKSTTIPLTKIASIDKYSDAIAITKDGVLAKPMFVGIDGVTYGITIETLFQQLQ